MSDILTNPVFYKGLMVGIALTLLIFFVVNYYTSEEELAQRGEGGYIG